MKTNNQQQPKLLRRIAIMAVVLLSFTYQARAQWAVIDPTNLVQNVISALKTGATATNTIKNFEETVKIYQQGKDYYDALKKVKNLVKDARKVQQTILMIGDISDIYVGNFQKMIADPYYTPEELGAIAAGYAILLEEAGNVLGDLKSVVNESGFSMSDKDRLDIVDRCYDKIYEYRALTQYYTNKTIGVSWLRAKRANDTQRILSLYGNPTEKYW